MAEKVAPALTMQWSCITDLGGLSTYGLKKGNKYPAYSPVWV